MATHEDATTLGHEHEDRTVTIVINTRAHRWAEKTISFEELIDIVYPGQPVGEGDDVTVKFSRGHDHKRDGSLTAGHSVPVKNKMVFDVYRTARS